MPHGAPDWYKYRRDSATHPVDDLAELAVRLGSIVTFDRRGDVIWVDSFNHGLTHWDIITHGDGAEAAISPASFVNRGYSAKLTCGSTGAAYTALRSYKPYPHAEPFGLEASFTIETNHASFTIYAHAVFSGKARLYQLIWNESTHALAYFTTSGYPIPLSPTLDLKNDPTCFHTLKMVFDPINNLYVRAILDHQTWDLSTIPPYITDQAGDPYLAIFIQHQGDTGTNAVGYVDNVILTQDEP